jgi:glycosyltransferase involved in cell wall biosynthesis
MQYVRWIARGMINNGYDLQLVTFPESLDHPLYSVMQEECQHRIRPVLLPDYGGLSEEALLNQSGLLALLRRELTYHRLYRSFFRRVQREERPDVVFVPYMDYLTYAAALLGSPFGDIPWAGIVMRPSFHLESMGIPGPRSRLDRLKEKLFFRLLKNKALKKLLSIDESLVDYVSMERPELADRIDYLPDPAELVGDSSKESARQRLGIPLDATVILVYGALTARKGIDSLLLAAGEDGFPPRVHLLLAGRQSQDVANLLRSPQAQSLRSDGRLHEQNCFLDDNEEYDAFKASDIVWMGYRGHYTTSGVLVQSGAMGLPVISCMEGVIGWLTRKHGLGLSVEIDNPSAVAEAVAILECSSETAAVLRENALRFAASHSPLNLSNAIGRHFEVVFAG